jgi:hypothetical protein
MMVRNKQHDNWDKKETYLNPIGYNRVTPFYWIPNYQIQLSQWRFYHMSYVIELVKYWKAILSKD